MLAVLLQTAVEKECALLDDWFGFFVQCMLGVAAFLSLVFKRYLEPVQRPWPTFLRDALKQGIGAGVVVRHQPPRLRSDWRETFTHFLRLFLCYCCCSFLFLFLLLFSMS